MSEMFVIHTNTLYDTPLPYEPDSVRHYTGWSLDISLLHYLLIIKTPDKKGLWAGFSSHHRH